MLIALLPVQAFKLFPHKTKQAPILNENILIEGKFTNSQATESISPPQLDLRIAIHIPRDQKYLTITTLYDEINENPIEQISWVIDNGKKKPATRIKPFKIEQIINQNMESLVMEYNPTLAYDRIHHNKHIINRTFYFDQAAIFGNTSKTPTQFLELYIPEAKGIKTKSIRIDQKLYQAPPELPKNNKLFHKPNFLNFERKKEPVPNNAASIPPTPTFNNNTNQIPLAPRAETQSPTDVDNDQEQQQLQQMQQEMQLDSLDEEDYGEEGDEDPF